MSGRIKAVLILLIGLLAANFAFALPSALGSIITLAYFFTVPGYLLLKLLDAGAKLGKWETFSLSTGLSILILMASGLGLSALHGFGLDSPLTTTSCFMLMDVIVISLLGFATPNLPQSIGRWPSIRLDITVMAILLTSLPLIAAGGAFRLNNGGSSSITLLLFGIIFVLFMLLIARQNMSTIYPYAVIMFGLSVLLTVSMRSALISGHDIQHEFAVFQITNNNHFWSSSYPRGDPYNACLSITILPTMIAKLTTLWNPYIFKIIFQILFAIGLLPIFLFIKKLSNSRTALIGAIIFISFPAYVNDLPFLTRQEIAFIFFGMLMMVSFMNTTRTLKMNLTILSLTGLILAHYSSAYVATSTLLVAYLGFKLLGIWFKVDRSAYIPILKPSVIGLALVLTFMWNSQITTSTNGLKSTVTRTVQGLLGDSSSTATGVTYSLFSPPTQSPTKVLAKYAGDKSTKVVYSPSGNLALTNLGRQINKLLNVDDLNANVRLFSAKILQVLLLLGLVILLMRLRKEPTTESLYLLALSSACLILLILITVLPELSVDYGVTRLFQQTLIITALPIIIATEYFLQHTRFKYLLPSLFFGFLFLDLSGFVPQILGGYPAQFALNNAGVSYDIYYHHIGESLAGVWVSGQSGKVSIAADAYAANRLPGYPYEKEYVKNPILANPYNHNFYLLQDNTNATKNIYANFLSGSLIEYHYISPLVSTNLIYTNANSKIYHD